MKVDYVRMNQEVLKYDEMLFFTLASAS